jgi:hypothetical protein
MTRVRHRPPRLAYFTGLDLGRSGEFTALAVVERAQPDDGRHDPASLAYAVRHLERFAPGTPYHAVFARLAQLFARAPLAGTWVAADQTAVGRPILDALRRSGVRYSVRAVTVTAGHASHRDERGGWLVPKKELAGTLQVLLQSGRLKVADALPEAATLLREMESFRAEVTPDPGDDLASWREREHDDLVLAVALAAWSGERHGPVSTGPPMVVTPASEWWRGL